MAPEVFSHRTGFKSDIWSAGVILYEMSYGLPPFYGIKDRTRKISAISSQRPIPLPSIHQSDLIECLRRCLQPDPNLRPSARRLLTLSYTRKDNFS